MHRFRPSRTLPVLLVAAGLAVSGCGGSADDGDTETAYVKSYQTACKALNDQVKAFQTDMAGLASVDPEDPSGMATIKSGFGEMLASMRTQFGAMADATAPERFADFQKQVVAHADQLDTTIGDVADVIAKVKEFDGLAEIGGSIEKAKFAGGEEIPDALVERAPACDEVRQRQS